MSTEHKVRWLLLLSILGLVAWLVALDMVRSDTTYHFHRKNDSVASHGLKCVYNCDDYELMLDGLKHSYESF